ncbi:nucleoside diphosphate kinase regulator [Devosia sp. J2-20]|jgi:regulator of nucleoside diphosphate kinase|uniref:nucleoside diphosphate kinase regulator n=2 Tax=Devosiaceae TaxID=2831106 RepID=UPI00249CA076|nr:nucleoside diphosphate kinase regulator [Devosia sp. J2-20]WDQ99950.1 nucleoside diphosphate kinase regulator [Devosia sp. J2-20]
MRNRTLRPQITVCERDHRQLMGLAEAGSAALASAAESLLVEMERARVVPDAKLPADSVRMGSRVRYVTERDEERAVTLVYPVDADIAAGKVSVLTPVGAALIGMRAGKSISWTARDGRTNVLTVTAVEQPQTI